MSAMLKQKLIDIANGFTKYGLWKGGESSALSEMTDVTFTDLQKNNVLTYNGSVWVNDDNLFKIIGNTDISLIGDGTLTGGLSKLNNDFTLLNKHEGTLLGGENIEIYFNPGDYFEITVFGLITRMCKIIGQFRLNGTPDYWVDKPSESIIQVSGNTNRIIIGNPSGDGSIDIYSKIFNI